MYPEPHTEPLVLVNHDEHQQPWQEDPEHATPRLNEREGIVIPPLDEQGESRQEQTQNQEPDSSMPLPQAATS
jgi:hypothetical protein